MRSGERLVCACGGTVERPLPTHCPHCGAKIKRVRRRWNYWPIVAISLIFAVLLISAWWIISFAAQRP